MFLKGLLDKLGIQADFIQIGDFKGAAEPLTRDRPSKEMEEVLGAILDQRYQTMVAMAENGLQYGAAARAAGKKLAILRYVANDGNG